MAARFYQPRGDGHVTRLAISKRYRSKVISLDKYNKEMNE